MYSFTIQTSVGRQHEEDQLQRVVEKVKKAINSEELLKFSGVYGTTKNMKRYLPFPITPNISFNNTVSEKSTAIKITARDKPDLFHKLTRAFKKAGANVSLAKITTHGHQAIDTFFVQDENGEKINEEDFSKIIEFIHPIIQEPT